jgi:23S rRNA (uracil1939-C5)-methyltransferase
VSPSDPVRIDALAFGGEGVGTLPSGKRVFVPLAVPGDLVRLEVVEDRERVARARLVQVIEPGPARIPPPWAFSWKA